MRPNYIENLRNRWNNHISTQKRDFPGKTLRNVSKEAKLGFKIVLDLDGTVWSQESFAKTTRMASITRVILRPETNEFLNLCSKLGCKIVLSSFGKADRISKLVSKFNFVKYPLYTEEDSQLFYSDCKNTYCCKSGGKGKSKFKVFGEFDEHKTIIIDDSPEGHRPETRKNLIKAPLFLNKEDDKEESNEEQDAFWREISELLLSCSDKKKNKESFDISFEIQERFENVESCDQPFLSLYKNKTSLQRSKRKKVSVKDRLEKGGQKLRIRKKKKKKNK